MDEKPTGTRIVLELGRARGADRPFEFQWLAEDYVRHLDGGAQRAGQIVWASDVQEDLVGLCRTPPDPAAQARLGDALLALLRPMGWDSDEAEILASVQARRPVQVLLRFAAAELYALPWELLPIGDQGRTLGDLADLRYQWPTREKRATQAAPPESGRLLFAWAGHVPLGQHLAAIGASFDGSGFAFDVLNNASYADLAQRLRAAAQEGHPYNALHLLAHGAPIGTAGVGLALEGGVCDGLTLGKLIAEYVPALRLVVLCACRSADPGRIDSHLGSLAQRLHMAGVADVLASRLPLAAEGSVLLAQTVYPALLAENPPMGLERALEHARKALLHSEYPADALSLQRYVWDADTRDTRPFVFRPYRGLLAFEPRHRRFFFGRDAEVTEVRDDFTGLARSGRPRLLVVEGASGTGKSSVVLAGLVPQLVAEGWAWTRMVPGRDPLGALDTAVKGRSADGSPWLLVVDQLEELFTQVPDDATGREARDSFTRRLWSLAAETGVHIVATLRSDYRGRCGEVHLDGPMRMDMLFTKGHEKHTVFIAQLSEAQLRDAIVRPADAVGLALAPALAEQMLVDVGAEPGSLPLLEYTLDLLWERREGDRLSADVYQGIGGVGGALTGRAEAILGELGSAGEKIVRRLLVRLVDQRGEQALDTRRRVLLAELRPADPEGATAFDGVLARLVDARLLVRGGTTVEVAHEALIRRWDRLQGWVKDDREMLVALDRVNGWVKEWQEFPDRLLNGAPLGVAQDVCGRYPGEVSQEMRALIMASEAEVERLAKLARRRLWRGIAVACVAAVVLAVLGGIAWTQRGEARSAQAEAVAQAVRAQDQARMVAVREADGDPTIQAVLLREVERPESTKGWSQAAMDVEAQPKALELLLGHEGNIYTAALSPDGSQIVTASADGSARVWRVGRGWEPVVLKGHGDEVHSAAFSPDGNSVVTASWDHTARVWRTDGVGQPVILRGHQAQVTAAAFSPDGNSVVTASWDHTARVWRAYGVGDPVVLRGHEAQVWSAVFSPDGHRVVTASDDGTARIWRADGVGDPIVLRGHENWVRWATFSPDGSHVVTASYDNTARVWPSDGKGEPVVLRGHAGEVISAAFSPDGVHIVTASFDGTARVWRTDGTGNPVVLRGHKGAVWSALFSPDGKNVVTTSYDRTAQMWRADGVGDPIVLSGHDGVVRSATFSSNGSLVVTVSYDGTARVWPVLGFDGPLGIHRHGEQIRAAAFSPDGKYVVTALKNGTAHVWRVDGTGEPVVLGGHESDVLSLGFSLDGSRIVTASFDKTARTWTMDGKNEAVLRGHQGTVNFASFSSDRTKVVTASDDKTARVWRADGKGEPIVLSGHEGGVTSASFSPDESRIVTTSEDRTARIWDVNGKLLSVLRGHQGHVNSASFSPDGSRVATASDDGSARVWLTDSSGDLVALLRHKDQVTLASFSPDGGHVLTVPRNGTVLLWRADGAGQPTVLQGHENSVLSASFSQDGTRVVTASYDTTARVRNANGSGEPLVLKGHAGAILSAALSPDNGSVLTASEDGVIGVWPLSIPALQDLLWRSTPYCLPIDERISRLAETNEEATTRLAACQARVADYAAQGAY